MCGIRSAPRRLVRSYIHETGTFNVRAISETVINSQFHSFDDMPAPMLPSNVVRAVQNIFSGTARTRISTKPPVTKKTVVIYISPYLQRYVRFHLELPAPYFNG